MTLLSGPIRVTAPTRHSGNCAARRHEDTEPARITMPGWVELKKNIFGTELSRGMADESTDRSSTPCGLPTPPCLRGSPLSDLLSSDTLRADSHHGDREVGAGCGNPTCVAGIHEGASTRSRICRAAWRTD
jgi:hypothetical protein